MQTRKTLAIIILVLVFVNRLFAVSYRGGIYLVDDYIKDQNTGDHWILYMNNTNDTGIKYDTGDICFYYGGAKIMTLDGATIQFLVAVSLGATTLSSLTVTGNADFQGNIADSTGNLTLADDVDITYGLNVVAAITGLSYTIGANTLTTTEWAFLDAIDQSVATTNSPTWVRPTFSQSTGSSPFLCNSTTVITNCNADLLDGYHRSDLESWVNNTFLMVNGSNAPTGNLVWSNYDLKMGTSGSFTIGSNTLGTTEFGYLDGINQSVATGDSPSWVRPTFTQTTGSSPFAINSTTLVTGLNAQYINSLASSALFLEDGSVPMGGDLDLDGNSLIGIQDFTFPFSTTWTTASAGAITQRLGGAYAIQDVDDSNNDRLTFDSSNGELIVYNSSEEEMFAVGSAGAMRTKRATTGTTDWNGVGVQIYNTNLTANNHSSIFFMTQDTGSDYDYPCGVATKFVGRSATGVSGELYFGTANDAESPTRRMTIDKDGNVGIGTATPANKLDVYASTGTTQITAKTGATNSSAIIRGYNADGEHLSLVMYGSTATGTNVGINRADTAFLITDTPAAFMIATKEDVPLMFGQNDVKVSEFDTDGNFKLTNNNSVFYDPHDNPPSGAEGWMYFDDSDSRLTMYSTVGSAFETVAFESDLSPCPSVYAIRSTEILIQDIPTSGSAIPPEPIVSTRLVPTFQGGILEGFFGVPLEGVDYRTLDKADLLNDYISTGSLQGSIRIAVLESKKEQAHIKDARLWVDGALYEPDTFSHTGVVVNGYVQLDRSERLVLTFPFVDGDEYRLYLKGYYVPSEDADGYHKILYRLHNRIKALEGENAAQESRLATLEQQMASLLNP